MTCSPSVFVCMFGFYRNYCKSHESSNKGWSHQLGTGGDARNVLMYRKWGQMMRYVIKTWGWWFGTCQEAKLTCLETFLTRNGQRAPLYTESRVSEGQLTLCQKAGAAVLCSRALSFIVHCSVVQGRHCAPASSPLLHGKRRKKGHFGYFITYYYWPSAGLAAF